MRRGRACCKVEPAPACITRTWVEAYAPRVVGCDGVKRLVSGSLHQDSRRHVNTIFKASQRRNDNEMSSWTIAAALSVLHVSQASVSDPERRPKEIKPDAPCEAGLT